MRLILHADDFGYDIPTTEATIELLNQGILTSATIMVNMPAAQRAIDYATMHPECSFGVHLTYVDGLTPTSAPTTISSLVNVEGVFLPSAEVRKKALFFRLSQDDIVRESLAQIQKLTTAGVRISHLDSHGHLHKFPAFLIALNNISKKTGIERIRRVQNIFLRTPHVGPTWLLNKVFDSYITRHFRTTDYFYMSANSMDTDWAESILHQLDNLPSDAICEIGVHPAKPGYVEAWRVAERQDIINFVEKLKEQGKHQIISWNDL